jgi:hypothetical protein
VKPAVCVSGAVPVSAVAGLYLGRVVLANPIVCHIADRRDPLVATAIADRAEGVSADRAGERGRVGAVPLPSGTILGL